MNSLNILTSHITPSPSPVPSRSNSITAISLAVASDANGSAPSIAASSIGGHSGDAIPGPGLHPDHSRVSLPMDRSFDTATAHSETSPLLSQKGVHNIASSTGNVRPAKWRALPKRIVLAVWNSIRWVLQTLAAPATYLLAFLYHDLGGFLPLSTATMLFQRAKSSAADDGRGKAPVVFRSDSNDFSPDEKSRRLSTESDGSSWAASGRVFRGSSVPLRASSYAVSSESESDFDQTVLQGSRRKGGLTGESAGRRDTSGSRSGGDEDSTIGSTGNRRSVRYKINDDTLKKRGHRRGQASVASMRGSSTGSSGGNGSFGGGSGGAGQPTDISAQLKSPTSPAGALTKYPRTPAPPRPLIPRRQPSYLNLELTEPEHKKTLILDLDETLIHSMSKGGRMSTGHMVEVRLNTTFVSTAGQPSAGPQHPILYYVHKRPYCDEFLRRVVKWYNLVVFTASVQEYADPVIDWLESERKFFSARYYRQHCTFRHGAFIKDLSFVEPDLSKVMILDNSPLSYMFHQDNAIPIQGWISDHTDSDLLHLVPLFEALQYVSDVRALLALRGGEDGHHMA